MVLLPPGIEHRDSKPYNTYTDYGITSLYVDKASKLPQKFKTKLKYLDIALGKAVSTWVGGGTG